MSRNQPRGERNESTQYRKPGRSGNSNQQRNFQGGVFAKGGGGGASSATSNPAGRGYGSKKYGSNAQGGYSRARSPNVDSEAGTISTQNGPHQQPPTSMVRVSDANVTSNSSSIKLTDTSTQINTETVTRPSSNVSHAVPTSNVAAPGSEPGAPTTPAKGDPAKSFPLQFGSISPGVINGVQIPARTSSAPPNLDEQKKAQARQDSSRVAPALPFPSIPKQQMPRNAGNPDQAKIVPSQPIPKPKRDSQVSAAPSVTQTQKPALHHIPGVPMQIPFHQQQVPVQFGGPSSQIQSQTIPGTSLPLPMQMPMSMGNPTMQQPMFISGLQPHQGMLHQVQNFNYSTQMGHQLPAQLGSMRINVAPQFPQQQAGKFGGSRKSVKITHPETHEELRLDNSPGARSHPNVQPQSQPIPSFPTNHPMSYYTNSYSSPPIYFPASSSVPMSSTQVPPTSQPPRSYNQVTVKPPVAPYVEKEQLPASSSISVGKTGSLEPSKLHGADSGSHQTEVDLSSLSSLPYQKSGMGSSVASVALSGSINREDTSNTSTSTSTPVGDSALSLSSCSDGTSKLQVPDSINDQPNKLGIRNQQDQDGKQSTSLSNLASPLSEPEQLNANCSLSRTNAVPEITMESFPTTVTTESSNLTTKGTAEEMTGDSLGIKGVNSRQLDPENVGVVKQGETLLSDNLKLNRHSLESSLKSLSLEYLETTGENEPCSDELTSGTGDLSELTEEILKESSAFHSSDVKMTDPLLASSHTDVRGDNGSSVSGNSSSAQDDTTLSLGTSLSVADSNGKKEATIMNSSLVDQEPASVLVPSPLVVTMMPEDEDIDNNVASFVSPSSTIKNKVSSDANVVKSAVPRGKKKMKDLYRKAEAAGTSSDLYMAYKGPEEKKDTVVSEESMEKDSSISVRQISAEFSQDNHAPHKRPAASKVEPDDWEDAAEISPQLGASKNENELNDRDGNESTTKKYSRDFLLKFLDQCIHLPEGFEITSDIADTLMVKGNNMLREHSGPGRNTDRPGSGSRLDRRSSNLVDDDKWNKLTGPLIPGRGDIWTDGYGGNIVGFRPGQGGNYGVLRNPRAQVPVQYAGGILPGPMQAFGPQVSLQRNFSDSDRWQRGTGFQKGLMPSPQTPPPVMHKAERKYELGKVTDEEEAKQRRLKAILNKLTPQNFEKLFQQVKEVKIDNEVTLSGVISQIFDKALMEPTFCQMYADFCFHLAADLPELRVENEKITFKRLLLNKCQEEFERGEREEEEANKAQEEGEVKQTEEEREGKRLQARRRMLGNIRLIGELYKKKMLTERIMHECINKLSGQYENPDEENIEALCKLMSTIGEMIDQPKAKEFMDCYFDNMRRLSGNMKLSSRVRFMLKDAIDLRKNKWQQRRKVEGPKKIEDVHRDAAQERQAQSSRLARTSTMGNSVRRGGGPPPMDFPSRTPSMLSSPSSHMGSSFRAASPQQRGFGAQDVRMDERQSFENRPISFPLAQRPLADDSITLGPQGGLVRGMGFRGQPSSHNVGARIVGPGLNGFSSMPERAPHGQREDLMPRIMPDRVSGPSDYDQLHSQDQSVNHGNREVRSTDREFDRSLSTPSRGGPPTSVHNVSSEKVLSEQQLEDKSLAAIKEFYSARDEKEVALCIMDLNSPSFYPSMISVWITDSFERKDMERDLLTNLLVNLAKPHDGMISKDQLIKGFKSVLAILEEAVNDAPRASEFLGQMFARVITENIVSISEIGQLIIEGGEEPGQLVETGLAAEVMGSVVMEIKQAKGDSVLNEIRSSCNLRMEDFKLPGSNKSSRIDKFIRG